MQTPQKTPTCALLTAAGLALSTLLAPTTVAAAPATVDQEVAQRLQTASESTLIPVIVEGAEARVRGTGGHVIGTSHLLGATVAELTPAQVRTLAADPSIARIHFDSTVSATAVSDAIVATPEGSTPITFQQTIGATDAWRAGDTGQGVAVAVLDTGIETNNAAFGARVTARVDFVDPAHPAQGDPAGHGTHVAGIVAAGPTFASPGVAPDASLVSVRVLDAQGHGRLSSVIHGLEWAIAHRNSLGIRVVVMALGAPASGSYRDDLLASAAEMAWRSGLVVVAAAGNAGPASGTIETPGIDPLVITVGATDESGTAARADDVVPSWSSEGPTADGFAKPDLAAPGRKIVSVRVPGSTLDVLMPTHIEGPTTFRLTGTSEATAVTAGAAALLLEQRPQLHPDQVKAILTQSTTPVVGEDAGTPGSKQLSVSRALSTATPDHARQTVRPSTALLRLLASAGASAAASGQLHLGWDTVDWTHFNWDTFLWDVLQWDHFNWDTLQWDVFGWD